MTRNIFEIVVGRGTLKWDAVWRVIRWMSDPNEEHDLGPSFRDRLSTFCLGGPLSPIEVSVEFPLGRDAGRKTRHPDIAIAYPTLGSPEAIALVDDLGSVSPNKRDKIANLLRYARLSAARFPDAKRRIVVVTDTENIQRFTLLRTEFDEAGEELALLPLQTMARWIDDASCSSHFAVGAFREWASSL